ncbi:MAG: hypothetical protein ACKOW9_04385 [Candidatus Paceibacterota bacterium]
MKQNMGIENLSINSKEKLINTLRLLYSTPRLYEPLLDSWEERDKGTTRIIKFLHKQGLVKMQDSIVVDTLKQKQAVKTSRAVQRYILTSKGKRLLNQTKEDTRKLSQEFKKITAAQENKLINLLECLSSSSNHTNDGISIPFLLSNTSMAPRTLRWWVGRLVKDGYVSMKSSKQADIREVIPKHYRPSRSLTTKIKNLIREGLLPETLYHELRLKRTKYLDDIAPSRLGLSGATDYDHDIQTQKILAKIVLSSNSSRNGIFVIEPRYSLAVLRSGEKLIFTQGLNDVVFYQPDAEMREIHNNINFRAVLEYERYQNRKDAWSHIERFLGWVHLTAHPNERAILRFIVENDKRLRAYVELIEAFADHCLDNPEKVPLNDVTLTVTTISRIEKSDNALLDENWHRIKLPQSTETQRRPVLHIEETTPYNEYFARG